MLKIMSCVLWRLKSYTVNMKWPINGIKEGDKKGANERSATLERGKTKIVIRWGEQGENKRGSPIAKRNVISVIGLVTCNTWSEIKT